jgi:hypothetical protein
MLRLYERWLDGLGTCNALALADCYADNAEIAVFDAREGAVVVQLGRDSIGKFYGAVFDAYPSVSIERVLKVMDRWFVFTELLWRVRDADGKAFWFRTGDVLVPTPENVIVTQLGVGTRTVHTAEERVPTSA